MRVLVTGGAGFIGSNFIRKSIEDGRDVDFAVLDAFTYASNADSVSSFESSVEIFHGDIRDSEAVRKALRGCDIVVNFAAESHNDRSLDDPTLFFDTNLFGTMTIAMACVEQGVRLHHVSTDEVYGDLPIGSHEIFTLESKYNPSSPYSASKAASDLLVNAWARSFGLQATISNCSNNFGPNQHKEKLIPAAVAAISAGLPPKLYGDGLNERDWIHVDDHVDGIWAILEKGELGKTYLLGARDCVSNLDLVQALIAASNHPQLQPEFTADRPGHDRRYAIDPTETEQLLGWTASHPKVLASTRELLDLYSVSGQES